MVLQGKSILDVTKTLNAEGIPTINGKRWLKTTIHTMLDNEAYTGTVIWGTNSKDGLPPVRVEDAHPAIVSKREAREAKSLLGSRVPKKGHPRRTSGLYLLSGLAQVRDLRQGHDRSRGQERQVHLLRLHSLLKRGRGACKTPRLNAKNFENLIVGEIRENVLAESNIRDLVKLLVEEMDGVAAEQRQRLESVEEELEDVKRRLNRIWNVIETTDTEMADSSERRNTESARRNWRWPQRRQGRCWPSGGSSWTAPTPSPPSPRR